MSQSDPAFGRVNRSSWLQRRLPPPSQPIARTAFTNRSASIWKFTPYSGHIHVAPTILISKNHKGCEHPLGPLSPPPRSRRMLRSFPRWNKTDRFHGAKDPLKVKTHTVAFLPPVEAAYNILIKGYKVKSQFVKSQLCHSPVQEEADQ